MQSKYNEVKEKIVQAVPEIMELKFGCKVKAKMWSKSESKKLIWREGIFISKEISPYPNILFKDGTDFCYHDLKILGREITLVDVLLATGDKLEQADVAVIGDHAHFDSGLDDAFSWNLEKDSLSDQSPETLDFLHSILCGEEKSG